MKKLKLKEGQGVIRKSEFLSRPVHLGKLSAEEYMFYADFFPEAFEEVEEEYINRQKKDNNKKRNDSPKSE